MNVYSIRKTKVLLLNSLRKEKGFFDADETREVFEKKGCFGTHETKGVF